MVEHALGYFETDAELLQSCGDRATQIVKDEALDAACATERDLEAADAGGAHGLVGVARTLDHAVLISEAGAFERGAHVGPWVKALINALSSERTSSAERPELERPAAFGPESQRQRPQ
jgi:hypothetical protein